MLLLSDGQQKLLFALLQCFEAFPFVTGADVRRGTQLREMAAMPSLLLHMNGKNVPFWSVFLCSGHGWWHSLIFGQAFFALLSKT